MPYRTLPPEPPEPPRAPAPSRRRSVIVRLRPPSARRVGSATTLNLLLAVGAVVFLALELLPASGLARGMVGVGLGLVFLVSRFNAER